MFKTAAPELPFAGRLAQRLPLFHGWVLVLFGFLFGARSFRGLPVFVDPTQTNTGWSGTAILSALSVRFVARRPS